MAAATETAEAAARHRSIGLWGAAALVAGSMVGSGVYVLPATLAAVGSISILGWIAATLAALAIAGVVILLSPLVPRPEGFPDYVRAGLGPFFTVQATVAYGLTNWVGSVAIALAVAGAVGYLAPALAGPGPRLALTVGSIWLAVAACWAGPRLVARVEAATLAVGLLPVGIAAVFGWLAFQPSVFVQSWNPQGLDLGSAVGSATLTAFFGFLGVECAAGAAGAVRDPARNVARATFIGVLGAAALYIAASTVLMGIVPAAELSKSTAPFAEAGQRVLGIGLGAAIVVCALMRAQGCLTGWMLVAAETSRSAADAGAFPAAFRSRPGERVSMLNLLLAGGLMSLVAFGTASPTLGQQYGTLANISVILSLYTYVLAGGSLLRLSGGLAPGRRRLARIVAAAAIATSAAIIATGKPLELALCVVPVVLAALLYLVMRRR